MFNFRFSEAFEPALWSRLRYLILCGGAGSGKTEFAARKQLLRCETEGPHRFLNLRKVRSRVRESILEVYIRALNDAKKKYELNKSDRTITFFSAGGWKNELLFDGLDDPEKIKSIKGLTGIWAEEATEFNEKDFIQLDLRLREPTKHYKQIILSFNPDEGRAPWLKKMFFDQLRPGAFVHRSTLEDNPIDSIRREYVKQLDALEKQNPTMYKIYRLGEWGLPKGRIFNWDTVPAPEGPFDEIFYGGDFGYTVSEAAVARIYRRADEFWVEQIVYETGLTNNALGARMKAEGVGSDEPIYFDAAEPKSIQEIYELGFNAKPSTKGADSVRAGISYLQSLKIHIIDGSPDLVEERRIYSWAEDKLGNSIPKPVKFKDHLMDAIRGAIYTHMTAGGGVFFGFTKGGPQG